MQTGEFHHECESYIGDVNSFLNKVMTRLSQLSINVDSFEFDHICYRVKSENQYNETISALCQYGYVLSENIIGGRPITIVYLHNPIVYKHYRIFCIEIPFASATTFKVIALPLLILTCC